jgi:hypothetical protein
MFSEGRGGGRASHLGLERHEALSPSRPSRSYECVLPESMAIQLPPGRAATDHLQISKREHTKAVACMQLGPSVTHSNHVPRLRAGGPPARARRAGGGAPALAARARMAVPAALRPGDELDEGFSGLAGDDGMMTVAGFGSLLSGAGRGGALRCALGRGHARARGRVRVMCVRKCVCDCEIHVCTCACAAYVCARLQRRAPPPSAAHRQAAADPQSPPPSLRSALPTPARPLPQSAARAPRSRTSATSGRRGCGAGGACLRTWRTSSMPAA